MFEDRDRQLDLSALALLAVTIFLGLSLASYHSTDPIQVPVFPLNRIYQPDALVYPAPESLSNLCGQSGALAADLLLRSFGWGAYFLVLSLATLVGYLLCRRQISAPVVRIIGWFLTLIGLTTMISIIGPATWTGPMIGPGGYVGAIGNAVLTTHFATVGGLILAFSITLFGLILWTDYVLFQMGWQVGRAALDRSRGRQVKSKKRTIENDVDNDVQTLAVRIGGKRVEAEQEDCDEDWEEDQAATDDYEEEEEEEEAELEADQDEYEEEGEEDEFEEEEPAPAPSSAASGLRKLMGKATPALRVRKVPEKDAREEVIEQLNEASLQEDTREYQLPDIDLLIEGEDFSFDQQEKEVRRKARILEKTFKDFGFQVKVVEIETGPVIAQYEIELEAGLRLSRITGLADDLAIALRVPSVRIVAPIPGKNTVGIEVPNEQRQVVRLREVMEESNGRIKKMRIPLFLGKDVSGNPLTVDLSTLPHLLIAGRTGTGKSVCLNAIISSILMTRRPDEVRMLMIDPKMVELSGYRTLPHLMHPVVTDMRKAEAILAWAVDKMEERYELLARAGVRHISGYNQLGEEELMERLELSDEEREAIPLHLPYIVIVADEMADLMMTSGKEVEQHIIRLAQKSRAVGIHLILATQKPTVDVITGLIKSNLPARIAFQVASRTDSRVVLDEMGADKLLGNGDMLFLWPGTSALLRGQGTFLTDDEINSVVECVSTGEQNFVKELVQMKVDEPDQAVGGELKKRDDLYESAVDIVIREGRGSVSLLQRCLGIGYGRAARLIDFMAEDGIVGPYNGSQAREVVMSLSDWQQLQGGESAEAVEEEEPTALKKKRSNKIVPSQTWDESSTPTDAASDCSEDEEEEQTEHEEETSRKIRRPSVKAKLANQPADNESVPNDVTSQEEEEEEEEDLVDEYEDEDYEVEEYEYDEEAAADEEGDDEPEGDDEGDDEYDEGDAYDEEEYETEKA
ncbi:MAG: DNA translocase FtsK 4TM domain-containing protein [Pirellulaceae bacterium]|nr:DNA translocase FtsK 4TM domain-containing protein [Pirellulaceae bacterium]